MGARRLKVIDVARELELNRSTIDLLYKDEAKRIDLEALDKLCHFFECTPNEILNFSKNNEKREEWVLFSYLYIRKEILSLICP